MRCGGGGGSGAWTPLVAAAVLAVLPPRAAGGGTPAVLPPARALIWHFFPLKVHSGQAAVKCGGGAVVRWFVKVGDYVAQGDPVCETCPDEGGKSKMCASPSSGRVVSEQPLGPKDDILTNVPDGVLAVIEPKQRPQHAAPPADGCTAVTCPAGSRFEEFLVGKGDFVKRHGAVALALSEGGMISHCRAPADGFVKSVEDRLKQGDQISNVAKDRRVACLQTPPGAGTAPSHHAVQHQSCPRHHQTVAAAPASAPAPAPASGATEHLRASAGAKHSPHHGKDASDDEQQAAAADSARKGDAHGHQGQSQDGGDGGDSKLDKAKSKAEKAKEAASRMLPLASIKHQMTHGKHLDHSDEDDASGLGIASTGRLLCLIGFLIGLFVVSILLLFHFLFCTKSQTRSLYVLMQDRQDEEKKGVQVDFVDQSGNVKTFYFEKQPLGIVFSRHAPFKVDSFEFNSYAKDRGVQLGWMLKRIADKDVSNDHSYENTDRWLRGALKNEKFWPLRVDFDTGDGVIKTFYFEKQPLGIEITNKAPFEIALFKPDSYAKACGTQLGWEIIRVGDAVVNCDTTFNILMKYFNDGLGHSPQEAKGARMDYIDQFGNERVFYFQRRPLGMVVSQYAPFRVERFEFNSYAKDRGVQLNWTVTKIGAQEITNNHSFEQVDRWCLENAASLPVWPLRIDFDTGGGAINTIYFEKQPLGMELLNKLPIKVDTFKPDSYASSCGVQVGWVITRVGDADVTLETKFEQVIEYLVEGVCDLPNVNMNNEPVPNRRGTATAKVQQGARSSVCF